MAVKSAKGNKKQEKKTEFRTSLRTGDPVMIITGGNTRKNKQVKGVTGKIQRFLPKKGRAVVEGANMIVRHKKAVSPGDPSGRIEKEGSIDISNLMYYSEELKKPVRIKYKRLDDGRKVRGFLHPETKAFEQIDA